MTSQEAKTRVLGLNQLHEIADRKSIPQLKKIIQFDRDESVRSTAVWVLGELGSAKDSQFIARALQDHDKKIRMEACNALSKIRDGRTIPRIAKVLLDEKEHPMVRMEAGKALGNFQDERAWKALIEAQTEFAFRNGFPEQQEKKRANFPTQSAAPSQPKPMDSRELSSSLESVWKSLQEQVDKAYAEQNRGKPRRRWWAPWRKS